MVVVITGSGLVRSVILEIEASLTSSSLTEVEAVLNERLSGLSLANIRDTISKRMADLTGHGRLIKLVIDSKDKIWTEERGEEIHFAGADKLLRMPEFADRERLSRLMKLLEDGKVLSEFLNHASEEGLVITIGRENRISEIINCSIVTSTYRVGSITGTIGVIGPTRMPYSKLVSVVEYTARSITEVLAGLDEKRNDR
jgi:heat-inducible transcriptional repressor